MRKHWEGMRHTLQSAKQCAPLQNSISAFLRVFHALNKWAGSFTGPLLKSPSSNLNKSFSNYNFILFKIVIFHYHSKTSISTHSF